MPVLTSPSWSDLAPRFHALESAALTGTTADEWLTEWSTLSAELDETNRRLEVASTRNTADTETQAAYHAFLRDVYPEWQRAEQRLKERLLASGVEPAGFSIQLRKMRSDAALFRPENVDLLGQARTLSDQYGAVSGGWTARWDGEDRPLADVRAKFYDPDRAVREAAWNAIKEPVTASHDALADIWRRLYDVRGAIAHNADCADFREYRWHQLWRFDYSVEDARQFHRSIEQIVVPVMRRLHERRTRMLGLDRLRPWDLAVDPSGKPGLRPFDSIDELEEIISRVFAGVAPEFGEYFDHMRRDDLLDLDVRRNKAQGGYCLPFNAIRVPFIFLSLTGTGGSVTGLLHEGGHAFHVFEMAHLPYVQQRDIESIGAEFGEVGSMAMELLAQPYMPADRGGFYSAPDADRALAELLEGALETWCWVSVIDELQHWAYEHPDQGGDLDACGEQFRRLYAHYFPAVDLSGLDRQMAAQWQQIGHPFQDPFYYIEYGFAQLGAIQIWSRALHDQREAVARYRHALGLGDTRSIPDLFAAAGAHFGFDAATLRPAVELMVETIEGITGPLAP